MLAAKTRYLLEPATHAGAIGGVASFVHPQHPHFFESGLHLHQQFRHDPEHEYGPCRQDKKLPSHGPSDSEVDGMP